jgi:hypothetical protein
VTCDAMAAALLQLAEHADRLARLDVREAGHHQQLVEQLAELAELLGNAARPAGDESGDQDGNRYQPIPAPRWWQLDGQDRDRALDRLRGWVTQVYRPGYGQLAATLGPCWEQHPLCLYGLDLLAELWSLLYLQPDRTADVISAQAEFQARIVPAIAEQLMIETTRCGHSTTRPARPARSLT